MPDGHDADAFRREVLARYDMSLGTGLGKLAGRVFRIGTPGLLQRPHALRHAVRGRDGPCGLRRPHTKNGVGDALAFLAGAKQAKARNDGPLSIDFQQEEPE
jgi:alanine-glyoxylate transaminase/serine-glyoxylate transaminase/serine-pyruvate transaminase